MKLSVLIGRIGDIEKVARLGFAGVELAVEAFGWAAPGPLDGDIVTQIRGLYARHDVEITALAYHALAVDPPPSDLVTTAYERVFAAAEELGVRTVASMSGFDADRDWAGTVQFFAGRFG
jgi:sugar phosphate isomerase/epimerase